MQHEVPVSEPVVIPPGNKTQVYANIRGSVDALINGVVLVVDPSMGSLSSLPGWAVYRSGVLVDSGVLEVHVEGTRWSRLKEVYRQLANFSAAWKPDVCVYEEIPVSAHGGRSQVSHASLLLALGVTMAAVDAPAFVGIPPISWKRFTSSDYVKSDEQDAIEMGRITISMARSIMSLDPPRRYRMASTGGDNGSPE